MVCFQMLPAKREAGPQLADADIDHVVLTGSTATGRSLSSTLGQRLITSTLELSGCDLLLLLDDGDVELAARGAFFGATANAGQACVGTRRAFVHRSQLDTFLKLLTPMIEQASPVLLVISSQAELANRLVADALEHGARLIRRDVETLVNGQVQPAALIQSSPNTLACREAFLAPLLTVIPYDDLNQYLEWDSQCPFSLGASIFTADHKRALDLSSRLRCGVVHVNDVMLPMVHPATPFGGRGDSGWGKTKGIEGLLEMTVPQVVSFAPGRFRPHYDVRGSHRFFDPEALKGIISLRHAGEWGAKLSAAWYFVRNMFGIRRNDS